jgi:hypothetical protein
MDPQDGRVALLLSTGFAILWYALITQPGARHDRYHPWRPSERLAFSSLSTLREFSPQGFPTHHQIAIGQYDSGSCHFFP